MSNPSGPDQPDDVTDEVAEAARRGGTRRGRADEAERGRACRRGRARSRARHRGDGARGSTSTNRPPRSWRPPSRREARGPQSPSAGSPRRPGSTRARRQRIDTPAEPATEVIPPTHRRPSTKPVAPQVIPPRGEVPKPPPSNRRSWGWVIALLLVIAALVAVAVLGTVLLTRNSEPKRLAGGQGPLDHPELRRRDPERRPGHAAQHHLRRHPRQLRQLQRPLVGRNPRTGGRGQAVSGVASIDQVVVNGDHAEANVTTFMAYAPQTRSTRSFDLQFRDDQWKICQAPNS